MLLIETEGPISTLTINRPEKLNCLNWELISSLTESIKEKNNRKEIRIIILTAMGNRAFAGGADIGIFADLDPPGAERL